ncbi:protein serine/threonine phosphatase [Chthoniobacter flavus Ellin428]|uniref:Protein serine/threonine phosphatase n=2 Tax=Chthoniobacter flavus TaxID=191863 RepID=B4CZ18_9BACT|nr:protein serine/threonine phosphatase [Chthoniobacter flavus Ellin428]TCO89607.1 serine/threonine protein phosphatase PrpC [Chthoniobacter flavus]
MALPFLFRAFADEDLKVATEPGHYIGVPKSKASAHPPKEHMNLTAPPVPTRFSGAKKSPVDEHVAHRYTARGAWICHTGRVRRVNEDSLLAGSKFFGGSTEAPAKIDIATGPWIVAVSDGIGGHRGGAEASKEVVEALAQCSRVTPVSVADTLRKLNRDFCERGQTVSELAAMGATVAGIGCGGRGLFAFNVGDSRVYRQDGEKLVQITRDDSEAEDLIDVGLLQPYDGPRPGFLHALTQAIGGREEVIEIHTHIHQLHIEEKARFLICSDGLTDMLHSPEILEVLCDEKRAERAATSLFQRAMNAGGVDNITLAVVEIERS